MPKTEETEMNVASQRTVARDVREPIDPAREPEAWVMNNERITNEGDLAGWLSLYAPDVIFEAITDGAYDRIEGYDNVAASVRVLGAVLKRHQLKVKKRFVAAQGNVIANAWSGGFAGRDRQFGFEIWTLRGSKVVRHEQYTFVDVRPSDSTTARFRALFAGELAVKLAISRKRSTGRSKP